LQDAGKLFLLVSLIKKSGMYSRIQENQRYLMPFLGVCEGSPQDYRERPRREVVGTRSNYIAWRRVVASIRWPFELGVCVLLSG